MASDSYVNGFAQVWLEAQLDAEGRVQLAADSDSELTRGMCTLLTNSLSGLKPDDFLQVRMQLTLTLFTTKAWFLFVSMRPLAKLCCGCARKILL